MSDQIDLLIDELHKDREESRKDREETRRFREEMRKDREQWAKDREQDRRRHAEWSARMDRAQDQTDENLRFLGELNRRNELVLQEVLRESRESRREARKNIAESRARTAEINARIVDIQEEGKAHTQAIFALIDRIERMGEGPAPAA